MRGPTISGSGASWMRSRSRATSTSLEACTAARLLDVAHVVTASIEAEDRRGRDRRARRGARSRCSVSPSPRSSAPWDRGGPHVRRGASAGTGRDRVAVRPRRGRACLRAARVPRGRTNRDAGSAEPSGGLIRADRAVDDRATVERLIERHDRPLEDADRDAGDLPGGWVVAFEQRDRDRVRSVRDVDVVEDGSRGSTPEVKSTFTVRPSSRDGRRVERPSVHIAPCPASARRPAGG